MEDVDWTWENDAQVWDVLGAPNLGCKSSEWRGIAADVRSVLTEDLSLIAKLENASPINALDSARVEAGVPAFGVDYDASFLPQEAGLSAMISFTKGCYVGQEPVIMLEHRGKPTKRVMHVRCDAPVEVGTPITSDEKVVGRITSISGDQALATIKRRALESGQTLEAGQRVLSQLRVASHMGSTKI